MFSMHCKTAQNVESELGRFCRANEDQRIVGTSFLPLEDFANAGREVSMLASFFIFGVDQLVFISGYSVIMLA